MGAEESHAPQPGPTVSATLRVAAADLRWCCDEAWLSFASTDEVEALTGVVGHDDTIEALRFGLEITGPGQHIFVRGLPGTGRLSLVRQLLDDIRPTCPLVDDRCYVHNFAQPDHPRLLTVPRSQGSILSRRIDELITFIQHDLGPLLASDALRAQRATLDDRLQEEIRRVGEPLEADLQAHHLALVLVQAGATGQPALLPVIDGTPVSPERFRALRAQGAINEAEDVNIKVILLSDPALYALLEAHDPDFAELFKVLADYETSIARNQQGVRSYAGFLAHLARHEGLPPFARDAVVALTEQGARIVARRDRLTTQFGRLADIPREATFLADRHGSRTVTGAHVQDTTWQRTHRVDLPARHFRTLVAEGTLRIQTRDAEVGQVNGLVVSHAGSLTYGFPSRITATIGPGTAGAVHIEREADLSGAIHTKGFYMLGGLLRFLLRSSHPLAFSASIAFEQSYGGIDGDSASGAEMCCLLSALTDVPLRQDPAMTGAIGQRSGMSNPSVPSPKRSKGSATHVRRSA